MKRSTLLVTSLSSFIAPFMMSGVNVALPAIGNRFAMSAVQLSWVATSYILATAVFLVPFGKVADMWGRRKIMTGGITLLALSSLLLSVSVSGTMLICLRIIQGLGGAMVNATALAIVSSVFPPTERGRAIGINVAAVYVGLSAGPFLGGLLTHHLGWQGVFLAPVPVALTALGLALTKLEGEWADARGEKFDLTGSLYYCLSLTAVMAGLSRLPSLSALWLVLGGAMGFAGFVRHQLRVPHPLFRLELFKNNRTFTLSNVAALIHYAAVFSVAFLLSLYLQYIRGMSPQGAGLVLLAQPLTQAFLSPFAGRLSDRMEPRIVASSGMVMTGLGLGYLAFISPSSPISHITAALIFLGSGYGLFSSPNMNAIMGAVERKHYGLAASATATMRTLGNTMSMAIATLTFALLIGKTQIRPENYSALLGSLHGCFMISALLCAVGVWASAARGRIRGERRDTADRL